MSARCKHEDAREASRLDNWHWCPTCRQFLKQKELTPARFAEEKH